MASAPTSAIALRSVVPVKKTSSVEQPPRSCAVSATCPFRFGAGSGRPNSVRFPPLGIPSPTADFRYLSGIGEKDAVRLGQHCHDLTPSVSRRNDRLSGNIEPIEGVTARGRRAGAGDDTQSVHFVHREQLADAPGQQCLCEKFVRRRLSF